MDLFVYGTLSDTTLMRSLTGRTFPHERARLHGFRCFQPARSYPYILPRMGAVVEGLILRGIDETAIHQLDEYEGEGDLYHRTEVSVESPTGWSPCWTYVGNPLAISRLRVA